LAGLAHFKEWGDGKRNRGLIVSEILNFPTSVLRMSAKRARAAKATCGTITRMPSGPLPVMTGEQWSEFIRLLTPDEQQAFMLDVYKIINRYCLRIGGE
jgi:hypothetical protein